MEDDWGVKQFNRTTRKMSLTPDGSLLYERVHGPLRALDEIDELFAESRGEVAGALRVTAPNWVGKEIVLPLVAAFSAIHPAVRFELDFSDLKRDFVDDPVDVAFCITNPQDSAMIARPLVANDLMTVASPNYIARCGEPRHPQDLRDHRRIGFRFASTGEVFKWRFQIDGETAFYAEAPHMVFNDPHAVCEAAALGMGVAQIGSILADDYVARGALVPVMSAYAMRLNSLYLMYPHKENQPLRVRAFIDFVLEQAAHKK